MAKHSFVSSQFHKVAGFARRATHAIFKRGYFLSYIVGLITQFWLCVFADLLLRPVRAVKKLWHRVVVRWLYVVRDEWRRMCGGFALARERVRTARERGVLIAVLQALAVPALAVKRHKKALSCVGNVLMPVAAALVLMFTVQYWSNLSFGLSLEYDGQKLGYISDEKVFDAAAAMAQSRVYATDESLQVRAPKMTLAVVSKTDVLDEAAICDKIIQSSGDAFAEATGLYVDGELVGALTSTEDLDALLDAYLQEYYGEGRTVEFVQAISTQNGLYPLSTLVSAPHMETLLNAQTEAAKYHIVQTGDTLRKIADTYGKTVEEIRRLNGLGDTDIIMTGDQLLVHAATRRLQVRVIEMTSSEETLSYTTRIEKDASLTEGSRVVRVKGQNGSAHITWQTVFVDGVQQETTEFSKAVLKEPVEEVVVIGTKKQSSSGAYTPGIGIVEGDGVATGKMTWPVPAVRRVYQGFHGGHTAIDISGGTVPILNTPIVAADGGIVKQVNTNPNVGYGIYVLIDHGNGLSTMYAHLNSVSVTAGQAVSRGQEIGRGGSTGWSTGPHLHFEVRVGGRCVDPMQYLSLG